MNWLGRDWQELRRWVKEELASKRAQLEDPKIEDRHAQLLRGEIRVLKNIEAQEKMPGPLPRQYVSDED
jgi:hypothetical protein